MKNSFSIFIVVLFCAVLCVGLGFLNRDSSDSLGWNPNELYSNPVLSSGSSAFTNATISGEDVNNVGVAVSMRGGRVTSSPFHHSSSAMYPSASSSYAPAGASYGQSSVATGSSPIAHMTSSAEYRSFGGGGNGGAFGSSSSRHYASAPSSATLSISSPISYIGSSAFDHSSKSYGTSDVSNIQSSVIDNPVVASSSIYGPSSSVTDYINTYGTASYGSNGRSNVRGRQNLGPGNVEDTWLNWLGLYGQGYGTYDEETNTYTYDQYQLRSAYDAFCLAWNETMGKKPTWDEWLAWFMASEGDGNGYTWNDGENNFTYSFVPVGNVLPLLIFALLYMALICLKAIRIRFFSSAENK